MQGKSKLCKNINFAKALEKEEKLSSLDFHTLNEIVINIIQG